MNFRFVPFEEIDKNKWNGNIYYAHNGNIYGYYWYLKSVVREWDAIIEGDYQTVMPIPRKNWSEFQWSLMKDLGLYSVNALTKNRVGRCMELWYAHATNCSYSFNQKISKNLLPFEKITTTIDKNYFIDLSATYEDLSKNFDSKVLNEFPEIANDECEITSLTKPEMILQDVKISEEKKHILYRLFYNAMERGAGWHTKITSLKDKRFASLFFLSDRKNVYLIFSDPSNTDSLEVKLLDSFLQNNEQKVSKLYFNDNNNLANVLGGNCHNVIKYSPPSKGIIAQFLQSIQEIFPKF